MPATPHHGGAIAERDRDIMSRSDEILGIAPKSVSALTGHH